MERRFNPGEEPDREQESNMTKEERAHKYAQTAAGEWSEGNADERGEYWDMYWDAYWDYLDDFVEEEFDSCFDDLDDEIEPYDDEDEKETDDDDYYLNNIDRYEPIPESYREKIASLISKLDEALDRIEENKATPKKYAFFNSPESRQDVYQFSKAIAEHLKEAGIKNLIITDRSARPLYIGVREYWKATYPSEPMPGMYFVNPMGFKSREGSTSEEITKAITNNMWKDDYRSSREEVRSQSEIESEFQEKYKRLFGERGQKALLFDTCIHSGESLSSVVGTLRKLGFSQMEVGSVNPSDDWSAVRSNFYITRRPPEQRCYPFDRDRMIEKTFEHVYSRPQKDKEKIALSVALREEIKTIMKEHLSKQAH